jgi:hypothetical protein
MSRNPRNELLLRQLDPEEPEHGKAPRTNDREWAIPFGFFVDVLGGNAADLGDELQSASTVMDRTLA